MRVSKKLIFRINNLRSRAHLNVWANNLLLFYDFLSYCLRATLFNNSDEF